MKNIFLVAITLLALSNPVLSQTNKFDGSKISKAVVCTILGHSVSDMKVKKLSENLYRVTYFDPPMNRFQGQWVKTLIKIDGQHIIWKPDTKSGRWRNDPHYYGDEVITYKVKNNYLIITETYTDNSKHTETFSLNQLSGK